MLEGRTIVVTGALGALGSNVAEALEAVGAKVARLDHARVAAKQDLVFDGLDLTDEPATTAAMAAIVQRCGGICLLCGQPDAMHLTQEAGEGPLVPRRPRIQAVTRNRIAQRREVLRNKPFVPPANE